MLIKTIALWILIDFIISVKADSDDNLTVSVVVPEHTFKDGDLREIINGYRLKYISHLAQFPYLWEKITLKTIIWPTFPTTQYVLDTFCEEFLQNNVSVIIIAYKNNSDVIQFRYLMQLSNDVGIPVIIKNTVRDLGSLHPSVILETNPSVADEAKAMLYILSKFEFGRVCVITSSNADSEDFHREFNEMQKTSAFSFEISSHIKLRVSKNKELMIGRMFVIKTMYPECRVIVLHISKAEAQQMFPAAQKVGLTGREYQWIVTRSVFTHFHKDEPQFPVDTLGIFYDLFDEQPYMAISTYIKNYDRSRKHYKFLNDVLGNTTSYNQWMTVLDKSFQILESGLFNYLNEPDKNHLEDLIPKVNCGRHEFQRWTTGTALHKSFPINKIMDIVQLERWHSWALTEFTYTSVENRKHVHYTITFFEVPPFVITRTPADREKCELPEVDCTVPERIITSVLLTNDSDRRCCSGLFIDLLVTLSYSLNFTYNVQRVNDEKWRKEINGTWNAVIHELRHGRAQMIFSSLIIKPEINQHSRASNLILNASIAIMVAKKTDFPPAHAILQPFDILTWFVIVFVLIQVETWLMFAFEWLSPNGLNMKKILPQNHHFTLTQTYWLALTMLFKAPMRTVFPKAWPSRVIANGWAAFALIFIAIYTAKLANFMITKESHYNFKGITDERLLKSGVKVGTVSFESTAEILQKNFPKLYQRMILFNQVNISEGIKALKSRDLDAFIYDGVVLDYLAAQDKDCQLITLDNRYVYSGYGIVFSVIDGAGINNRIDRLVESGTISKWRDRWVGEPCKPNSNFQSISFSQFTSAFILLGLGITIAAIIFALEYCYSCYIERLKRKQRSKKIINSWWNLITQVRLPEREGLDDVQISLGCSSGIETKPSL